MSPSCLAIYLIISLSHRIPIGKYIFGLTEYRIMRHLSELQSLNKKDKYPFILSRLVEFR